MNQTSCFVFKGLFFFFNFKIEFTQPWCNKGGLTIVQHLVCQNIVFLMLIRNQNVNQLSERLFEIILNALEVVYSVVFRNT